MRYRININYTFDLGHALKKAQKAIADYTQNGQPVPVKLTAECDRLKRAENALDFRGSDALAARRIACDGKIVVGEFKATDGSGDTAALVAAAWDPEGRQPGAKKLCFHVDGRVRIYGQNGEVKPVRGPDGGYALDLPSDGAFFMVYGGRQ